MLGLLLLALVPHSPPDSTGQVYSGLRRQLAVDPPRLEETITIDGVLNEPVWQAAARLTDFSRYSPDDGRPAENTTEILVWYSPRAIHFGIRAHAAPGTIRATLADRDKIFSDDYILFFLNTFNDGRQALVFGVNPYGIQGDGSLVEGSSGGGGGGSGFGGQRVGRGQMDPSQDFVFESKGRLTEYGYEVEIQIPFKSLRYQSVSPQTWGLSVTRRVQNLGHEDSWVPARRAAPSFLGQAGTLVGLQGLQRGLVLDLTPVVTSKTSGLPRAGGGWNYSGGDPEFGGNVRWGITPNLNLNGTVRPDFAEVESDAGQVVFDPRQALFFSEKRPFFLDGLEDFATPNRLIHTRRILEPVTAAKLNGKTGRTTIGYIGAVDDAVVSATGTDNPVFNLLRVQHDLGEQSRLGMVYTDRIDGDQSNRVAGVDGRFVLGNRYTLQLQGANSWTDRGTGSVSAPLWQATLTRSGRTWAARANLRGIHQDFRALSGFIGRAGIANARISNQVSVFGRPGSVFERGSMEVALDGTWAYDNFVNGRASQDRKLHFNQNVTLRGGWSLGASVLIESFGYDPKLYARHAVERRTGTTVDTIPYNDFVLQQTGRLPNLDYVLSLNSPRVHGVSFNGFYIWGRDENFFEWASSDIVFGSFGLRWRPTNQIRVDGTYLIQSFKRRTDGSTTSISKIPRLRIEYQVTRDIFFRAVGEYRSTRQDDLRDDSRSGDPILFLNPSTGVYERGGALGFHNETFRGDLLLSVLPSPGTVLFAGYGSTLEDPNRPEEPQRLRRVSDAFFLKLSYLFRSN